MKTNGPLTSRRTWLTSILLIAGVASALPAIYFAATANPQGSLADLPVALVIEEQTDAGGPAFAEQVGAAVAEGASGSIAITRLSPAELVDAMREDRIAGAVVVPADFDVSIASLLPGGTDVAAPTVRLVTNAGDGGVSSGLLIGNLTPVLHAVSADLGDQLEGAVGSLPEANRALLAEPFRVASAPFEPLPEHSGLGTSAFYLALALVLVAFIGASLVGPLVDGALGFLPSEIGPLVARRPYTPVTRRRTFVAKAAILAASAPVAALAVQLIAAANGVTTGTPVLLWLFSTTVIAGVGAAVLAVFAALGAGIGSLVNTLFFVALAMVSSGGIVPLEATPPFFRWASAIAPFHHVVEGTRSFLYFDSGWESGLGDAWIGIAGVAVIGLALGLLVTTGYDRVPRFSRHPREDGGPGESRGGSSHGRELVGCGHEGRPVEPSDTTAVVGVHHLSR
ncbi:DUF3533 domain-containing protein [Microbacterium sp. Root180]|uniref:YhgE/Pip domain-containing protein n=1 Tax=Microbacterium sp. Root180 TaxID=1736483 RepID=UPI0006FF9EEE|nr:DUF3533 domain-containing protein [Microbacterium sp. Root180]KRB38928.1 hypothetical protein ASD93_03060 [Microbacterium sp. Root180]